MAIEQFWTPENMSPNEKSWIRSSSRSIPINISPDFFRSIVDTPDFLYRVTGGENVPVYGAKESQPTIPTRIPTRYFPNWKKITPEQKQLWPSILITWFGNDYRDSLNGTPLSAVNIEDLSLLVSTGFHKELLEQIPSRYRHPIPSPNYAWTPYAHETSMLRVMDAMCVRWLHAEFPEQIKAAFETQMAPLATKMFRERKPKKT